MAALWLLPISAIAAGVPILVSAFRLLAWARRSRPAGLPAVWIPLLAAITLSALASVEPWVSLPWVALAGAYLLTAWAFSVVCDSLDRIEGALRAIFWGVMPWVVFGMVLSVAKVDWAGHWGPLVVQLGFPDHRADSIFAHPNIFAGYLLLALATGLALGAGRWRLYGPALALVAGCLAMTQSRSAWIGMAAMAVVLLGRLYRTPLFRPQIQSTRLTAPFIALALAAFAVLWRSRLMTLLEPYYESNQGHLLVWEGALRMIAARPLLGWGPGTWLAVYPRFRDPREVEHLPHAHSILLAVASEQGVIALALLLAFFATIALRGLRSRYPDYRLARLAPALAAAIAGYFTMGLFEYTFSEGRNAVLLFAIGGLLVGATRLCP